MPISPTTATCSLMSTDEALPLPTALTVSIGPLSAMDAPSWTATSAPGAHRRRCSPRTSCATVRACGAAYGRRCVWSPMRSNPQFAYCESPDLINWKPQDYPYVEGGSCVRPILVQAENNEGWAVIYTTLDSTIYAYGSSDCRTWKKMNVNVGNRPTDAGPCQSPNYSSIVLGDRPVEGQVHRVEWEQIDKLIKRDDYLRNRQSSMSTWDKTQCALPTSSP